MQVLVHVQVNYFPSRFDPVRHSEKYPYQNMKVSGNREKMCIAKENNFAQAGARFRSFDPSRQDRFINRIAGMLTAPRVTQVSCGCLPAPCLCCTLLLLNDTVCMCICTTSSIFGLHLPSAAVMLHKLANSCMWFLHDCCTLHCVCPLCCSQL